MIVFTIIHIAYVLRYPVPPILPQRQNHFRRKFVLICVSLCQLEKQIVNITMVSSRNNILTPNETLCLRLKLLTFFRYTYVSQIVGVLIFRHT